MAEEQERKTLGQVCFEALCQARDDASGAAGEPGVDVPVDVRLWWEAGAQAVKAAVLAEQAEPTGPTTEQMAGLSTVALLRLRDELERAYRRAAVCSANRLLAENYERERHE